MSEAGATRVLDGVRIEIGDTVVVTGPDLERLLLAALEHVGEDGEVIAVDESASRLESLRSRCADPRVSYLIGDARVLPLPDASADVVLATGELDIGEAERVLRKRGRLWSGS